MLDEANTIVDFIFDQVLNTNNDIDQSLAATINAFTDRRVTLESHAELVEYGFVFTTIPYSWTEPLITQVYYFCLQEIAELN